MNGLSVSALVRADEYDFKAYEAAMVKYKVDPVTYEFVAIAKKLNLI